MYKLIFIQLPKNKLFLNIVVTERLSQVEVVKTQQQETSLTPQVPTLRVGTTGVLGLVVIP